jgi:VIT1/CCC1 family predicted Fe2+/Mn2+ transporter
MSAVPDERSTRVLDPMERISEVMFGTIMVLTFTCTLGIATADNIQIRTMLFAALGCNLAWGIIDGGVYLLTNVSNQARRLVTLRAMRKAPDLVAAQGIIADALPPLLASIVPSEQLESLRQKLRQQPEPQAQPRLTRRDWIGAFGICILSFLSTFPILIPFIFMNDARSALRISNAVATVMLFICGYAFGLRCGLRPWAAGLSMVAIGGAFVGVAVVLGG